MPVYQAPVAETLFVLNDVLGVERYSNLPGFSDASPDVVEAILGEAGRIAGEVFQPFNQIGDRQGCTRNPDGSVSTPQGFREAYGAFRGGGWSGLSANPGYGGQGLPQTLSAAVNEFLSSANMALAMYPGLTAGRGGEARLGRGRRGLPPGQARHRPLLHRARHARNRRPPRPHRLGRGNDDGAGGGGVLKRPLPIHLTSSDASSKIRTLLSESAYF